MSASSCAQGRACAAPYVVDACALCALACSRATHMPCALPLERVTWQRAPAAVRRQRYDSETGRACGRSCRSCHMLLVASCCVCGCRSAICPRASVSPSANADDAKTTETISLMSCRCRTTPCACGSRWPPLSTAAKENATAPRAAAAPCTQDSWRTDNLCRESQTLKRSDAKAAVVLVSEDDKS